jgi:PAS domain S-box-containing protein
MTFQPNPYSLPLLISALLVAGLAALAWSRRRTPGALPNCCVLLGMSLWALADSLRWASPAFDQQLFWAKTRFLGTDLITIALVVLVLHYAGIRRAVHLRLVPGMALLLLPTLLLLWTNESHALFWTSVEQVSLGGYTALARTNGPAYWAHMITNYAFISAALLALLGMFARAQQVRRRQVGAIFFATIIPLAANLYSLSSLNPLPHFDLTPLSFVLSGLVLTYSVFRFGLMDVLPAARSAVIENLPDGVVVLDQHMKIIDMNPAAEAILEIKLPQVLGRLLGQVIPEWEGPASVEAIHTAQVLSRPSGVYEPHISVLRGRDDRQAGFAIFLRDVSDRQLAEENLRRSQEKLKSLLDEINEGYYETGLDGTLLEVNEAFCRGIGYSYDQMIGANFRRLTDTRNGRRLFMLFNRIFRLG